MITPAGAISDVAGNTAQGFVDGTGSAARFDNPVAIASDSVGTIYVVEEGNFALRKISGGVVTTLAGSGTSGSVDGTGTAASFASPTGIAFDEANGATYVADYQSIRKVSQSGVVTTFASEALVHQSLHNTVSLYGVAIDATHNVYATSDNVVIKITQAGMVTVVAGQVNVRGSADGNGTAATFRYLQGIAIDSAGNLYVADQGNGTVRMISPSATVTTLAGTAGVVGNADGTGAAASFNALTNIAVDLNSNVYVADTGNHAIRKITPAGVVTTLVH